MILSADNAILGAAELLRDRIGPQIADGYAAQMARLSAGLLTICANGYDDAAELRVNQNAELRALLGTLAGHVGLDLTARLREAVQSADPGLKISVLDAETHRLRLLLVEAQCEIEKHESASALDQQIWQVLEAHEMARAPRE